MALQAMCKSTWCSLIQPKSRKWLRSFNGRDVAWSAFGVRMTVEVGCPFPSGGPGGSELFHALGHFLLYPFGVIGSSQSALRWVFR